MMKIWVILLIFFKKIIKDEIFEFNLLFISFLILFYFLIIIKDDDDTTTTTKVAAAPKVAAASTTTITTNVAAKKVAVTGSCSKRKLPLMKLPPPKLPLMFQKKVILYLFL